MDWNDPFLKEKPKKPTKNPADSGIRPMLTCTNCGKVVAISSLDHCRCSIWEVGKDAQVS